MDFLFMRVKLVFNLQLTGKMQDVEKGNRKQHKYNVMEKEIEADKSFT